MIKRRSTLDPAEKTHRNRQVQIFAVLDLCLQISVDDRVLLRKKIKEGDKVLATSIYDCKKGKDYHNLQIYLRKYLQSLKGNDKYGFNLLRLRDSKSIRGKTPLTLKTHNNLTEGSFPNSLHSSMQSSPSTHKKNKQVKLSYFDLGKKIQGEMNYEFQPNIQFQTQGQMRRRTINIQQQHAELLVGRNIQNISKQIEMEYNSMHMKGLLREKLGNKYQNVFPQGKERLTLNKQNRWQDGTRSYQDSGSDMARRGSFFIKKEFKEYQPDSVPNKHPKYGQFYKRIKKAIEGHV